MNNPGGWVTPADYPPEALREKRGGALRFLVRIAADGTPVECNVIESSGVPSLDEKTCSLIIKRAKFYPAQDADGRSVASSYTNAIRWSLPSEAANVLEPKSETLSFILDEDGSIKDCKFDVRGAGAEAIMKTKNLCNSNPALREPFRGPNGQPIAKRVIMKSSLEIEDVAQ